MTAGVAVSGEYESLRAEILKWQDRRFDLLKLSISVVTGLLGLKLIFEKLDAPGSSSTLWPLISSILLLYLAGANLLTWYAGVANSKLSAYVRVFHEGQESTSIPMGWETRLAKLKTKGLDPQNLNWWITIVYAVLAIISVVLPYAATSFAPPGLWLYGLAVSSAAFLATIILVVRFSYPREHFEACWRQLRDEERSLAK